MGNPTHRPFCVGQEAGVPIASNRSSGVLVESNQLVCMVNRMIRDLMPFVAIQIKTDEDKHRL